MIIKLRLGCWVVTRGGKMGMTTVSREIVNIIDVKKCACDYDCGFDYYKAPDGRGWGRNGKYSESPHAFDVVRVFATKEQAQAWHDWRLECRRFVRKIWHWAAVAAVILGVSWAVFGCAPAPMINYPHDCAKAGYHRHPADTTRWGR